MKKLWNRLNRPSTRWSVLALLVLGIVIGLALIILPHVGIKMTSSTEFCVSCHSMQPVYQEYKQSVHFKNASGVRAECHDCHIPPDIPGMVKRKLEASNDIYQTFIAHSIDTPEKFEAKRAELAEREWKRMKENNSATCRSCHNYDAMDHAKQHPEAAKQMAIAAKDNQSCIDCHKGIAHQLPDMSSGFRKQFAELRQNASDEGNTLYTLDMKPIYAAKGDKEPAGSLLPASEVTVLKRDGDWLQVQIEGWTETNGRQRVLSLLPGKRIFVSSIRDQVQKRAKTLEKTTVAATGVEWSKLQTTAWVQKGDLVNNIKPIWAYADALYNGTCNQCHGAPDKSHFDANGWIGTLNGMIGFTSLDKREERTLLKYLQMNASDTGGADQKH
ncbi:trimethylamine N-oxide reductase cytochrome c-type subunit [Edwardsiella hoshinae]|uniref:Cytochrome c-type protein n=1 Tax=Edwardsiella hoshinae TaxID=93378 RepID=A0A376DM64_9GAMM|nr:pentaheme c-type cytochrome TorC [Edwardsiella hoshinae]AOV98155.1 trimethylamine N-oxide reductase cytochrome c-type subunit [Edwardsiella hoshinae]QPR28959.1 pentaheme c-type cytochrome TorC [Edwardsiella hoshinae]STC91719.1 Cytochrome c-type protein TorC [Edwardsiella hoshinae]